MEDEIKKIPKPLVMVILDGWGEWDIEKGNALTGAKLPTIDMLNSYYPKLLLQASGLSVGLPWGVKGNSEVGHQTMGTGQIIFQYLPSIDMAIQSGDFSKNEKLLQAINTAKERGSNLHFLGLVSDGGVHSHVNHLIALLGVAKDNGMKDVYVHAVADGRDTAPKSAIKYLEDIVKTMNEEQIGKLATITGRYFTMDRNNNWDRIEKSFKAITQGGEIKDDMFARAIEDQYNKGIETDEYIEPINMTDEDGKPLGLIKDNDVVVCFNFRKDRSRQITKAFSVPDFSEFVDTPRPKVDYFCFTEYEKDLPVNIIFKEQKINSRLGDILSQNNKRQLRIAETEKYAHVTYFFNGGFEKPYEGEDRLLVPSKNAPSYATIPEMSAYEVTDKILDAIDNKDYDFILVNYANPDMVGHTGDLNAGIKAVEVVDENLDRLINKVTEAGGSLLITADHGNVEEMINLTTYEKDTEHSTNPVPCWLVDSEYKREEEKEYIQSKEIDGMIVDLAPTILDIFNIEKNPNMIGISLLKIFKRKV